MELDYALKEDFQLYKAAGVLASLLLVVGFQLLFPNRLALRDLALNWRVNLPIALINTVLMSLLCGACVCTWAVLVRENGIGFFSLVAFPGWLEVGATVVLLDWVAWAWHRANHRFRLLWRFHAVHHSDAHFDASTAFRFHPGELLISLGIRLAVVTLTGLPIAGLVAFEVIYAFFNLFVHSDIRLPAGLERLLGLVFVTPSLHRMHHSVRKSELDSNYGTIFSGWDRLWRTYTYAHAGTPVRVGLPTIREPVGLTRALKLPLEKS